MPRTKTPLILVINPGSTSTKVALFKALRPLFETTVEHDHAQLEALGPVVAQTAFRKSVVLSELKARDVCLDEDVDVIVGRGGFLRPVTGGVYAVNARMLRDLRRARYGEHASNLGAIIADGLAGHGRKPCYVANPVVLDELEPAARLTGHPAILRRSVFHALNQKAVAETVAAQFGRPYSRCNFVVAHVGGGVSIGAHRRGRVVDVNNALDGDGPFSPERTGSLPLLPFCRLVAERKMSRSDVVAMVSRTGGMIAHLGTNDCREIERLVGSGSRRHTLVFQAFVHQLAKAIGAGAAVLEGKVDAVVLTGGVMRSRWIRSRLIRKVRFIAPVHVLAGNLEMEALAAEAFDVWRGRKRARTY
jgi:butyrate kinase